MSEKTGLHPFSGKYILRKTIVGRGQIDPHPPAILGLNVASTLFQLHIAI